MKYTTNIYPSSESRLSPGALYLALLTLLYGTTAFFATALYFTVVPLDKATIRVEKTLATFRLQGLVLKKMANSEKAERKTEDSIKSDLQIITAINGELKRGLAHILPLFEQSFHRSDFSVSVSDIQVSRAKSRDRLEVRLQGESQTLEDVFYLKKSLQKLSSFGPVRLTSYERVKSDPSKATSTQTIIFQFDFEVFQ